MSVLLVPTCMARINYVKLMINELILLFCKQYFSKIFDCKMNQRSQWMELTSFHHERFS